MSSSFGKIFRLTTWGESHGPALGVVIDGCPAGIPLTVEDIQFQLDRRRTGQSKVTTPRGEKDAAEILSGVFEGVTTGAPISIITYNKDADSSKYENLRNVFGPVMPTTPTGRNMATGITGAAVVHRRGRRGVALRPARSHARSLAITDARSSASCARSAGSRWRRLTATRSSRTSSAALTR